MVSCTERVGSDGGGGRMRNAFAQTLTELAKIDPRVVLLSGDIGNKLFDDFKSIDQSRFYNCGVAEANMMGVAAGLALSGLRPVVYTITPFTTTRCFEQIRVDVCYQQAPVIIVGTGSGLSYAELGPTHHSLEDLAILRTLPGMVVCAPADKTELTSILTEALQNNHPTYIRIGKKGEADIHAANPNLSIGKMISVKPGKGVALIGAGTILPELLLAREKLLAHEIDAEVISCHTIKPLDQETMQRLTANDLIVTVEEHGKIGGLGSAVAEWMMAHPNHCQLISLGAPDEFMHEIGSQSYARQKYGLTAENIVNQVLQVW